MADLDPLIRYRKHGVDEKQKKLAELYRQTEELEQQRQAVEDQVETEKQLSEEMGSVDASAYLGRYLEGARKKIKGINDEIRRLETKIAVAQEDMRNAFAEMKKVEIVERNRKGREKVKRKRKEDRELDEIAIENYRRRLEEEDS